MTQRIVVTGGDGVMGRALREWLPGATYLGSNILNVCVPESVDDILSDLNPTVVIHAAALTNHQHPELAKVIETNIYGTHNVAEFCELAQIRLVYLSTHYVYPGAKGNYAEDDWCVPIGAYAWSKYVGEKFAKRPTDHAIIRGSWYTPETRLDHWAHKGALTDAWCSREPAREAAHKIATIACSDVQGMINIGGPRRTFAEILYDEGYQHFPTTTRAQMIKLPYTFPRDVSVDTTRFDQFFT